MKSHIRLIGRDIKMELLLFISGAYIVFGLFSLLGLKKETNKIAFQADLMVFSVFGFFMITGFSNMEEMTKETLGIICTIYGFIDLAYGITSTLIKMKREISKDKIVKKFED